MNTFDQAQQLLDYDNMRSLYVYHITLSLSRLGSGVAQTVSNLAFHQYRLGVNVGIICLRDDYSEIDLQDVKFSGVTLQIFQKYGLANVFYVPGVTPTLLYLDASNAVVHLHSIWLYFSRATVLWSKRRGGKYIVSLHGTLDAWALRQSRWKKRIAAWLWENENLRHAGCLHALTMHEYTCIRQYGLQNPICVIPNGIDVQAYTLLPDRGCFAQMFPQVQGKKILLFLSRLHPIKGIDVLLYAWSLVVLQHQDWVLVIAGDESDRKQQYRQYLAHLADTLNISATVIFAGPLYNEQKKQAFAAADAFVLSSISEGFPIVVLEAMACQRAVMITRACHFDEVIEHQAGLVAEPGIESLKWGLAQMMSCSDDDRREMGKRGRALVEKKYTWDISNQQMMAVYTWLLAGGTPPSCVILD